MALTHPGWERSPERLARAAASIGELRERGLFLAPIRHHSPACALAVEALIDEVRPGVVLIEGPQEYTGLVPVLQDARTRPPVAILSLEPAASAPAAGFYPLAAFSPEWVALRAAHGRGARVAFIDRSWLERSGEEADDAFTRTLQAERNLAHSATIAALARRFGCRDHDEVWDHLFEARPRAELSDWRGFFDGAFAWAASARLDYEDAVLDADGSLAREATMAAHIAAAWSPDAGAASDAGAAPDGPGQRDPDAPAGPVVVVTGAFHTLAIVEALTGAPEGAPVRRRMPRPRPDSAPRPRPDSAPRPESRPGAADAAWLIRYDHERLDGLRGYGAGMPSPGYYEHLWAAHRAGTDPAQFATELIIDIARAAAGQGAAIGTAHAGVAVEQAIRLAELRGRPWPCRTDVLDALTSCFVKDDGGFDRPLAEAIADYFGGRALGDVPPGTASPPLVAQARRTAQSLRLSIDDSRRRTARLDPRRKPRHRDRRQFLARMEFIGSGFAARLSGPDHVAGRGLDLILEEWQYAWTPLVESALVQLSHQGATVDAVVRVKLAVAERAADQGRSADAVARLIALAAVLGMTDQLPGLSDRLAEMLDADPSLASVVAGLHRITGLARAGAELGIEDRAEALLALVDRGLAAAGYLVPDLGVVDESGEADAIATLVSLRDLVRDRGGSGSAGDTIRHALTTMRTDPRTAPGVLGALVGMAAVDGDLADTDVVAQVRARLTVGADPVLSVRFLGGLMSAAPDLLLHTPEVFDAVHAALRDLPADAFIAVLPDLRRAFTWLKPMETNRLAQRVADRTGVRSEEIDVVVSHSPEALAAGLQLEQDLIAVLARDGLAGWTAGQPSTALGASAPAGGGAG